MMATVTQMPRFWVPCCTKMLDYERTDREVSKLRLLNVLGMLRRVIINAEEGIINAKEGIINAEEGHHQY